MQASEQSTQSCATAYRNSRYAFTVEHYGTVLTYRQSLVESLSGEVGLPEDEPAAPPEKPEATPEHHEASSPSVGKYIGSPFWATLSTEVQALRDALEEDPSDEEHSPTSPIVEPRETILMSVVRNVGLSSPRLV